MNKPLLILQMQRMGDLVLSFPLLAWLARQYPAHPLWVVAEETFFKGLMPLSPTATFFPPGALERVKGAEFELVVNLSHRPEAAALAHQTHAHAWFGRRLAPDGTMTIEGDWQLYRSSLTFNNRHNFYHWADLNALDVIPHPLMAATAWLDPARAARQAPNTHDGARIGLFLGASEPEKRPSPRFWADLALALLKRGLRPVFLGGEAEKSLGAEAARLAGAPALNLTGHFSVPELVTFLRSLALLITPDTGPMHVAAWMGIPVFNLSLGPVNPWETGPYQPGHLVAQATMSCAGCWTCDRRAQTCQNAFQAGPLAAMIRAITAPPALPAGQRPDLTRLPVQPGLALARSGRRDGLFSLCFQKPTPRQALGDFWRHAFACHLGYSGAPTLGTEDALSHAAARLSEAAPPLAARLKEALRQSARQFQADVIRASRPLPDAFWTASPPLIRPLTGYLLPFLQNAGYSRPAALRALRFFELLASF